MYLLVYFLFQFFLQVYHLLRLVFKNKLRFDSLDCYLPLENLKGSFLLHLEGPGCNSFVFKSFYICRGYFLDFTDLKYSCLFTDPQAFLTSFSALIFRALAKFFELIQRAPWRSKNIGRLIAIADYTKFWRYQLQNLLFKYLLFKSITSSKFNNVL